ncbi:unnamed protein product [Adineta steineri]|uniref:Uncharacterized protein n=1 Tax=Adineta steineri TaxID=433720 RepID=A0A819VA03_9BILA|nr:unnamed protein product [Adineta steineri]CAF1499158.1 unnamed protein product [Adineta steineri]CAF4089944.1 unnamed protein product [Adineta steineri]CAF4106015.1 unnamed protein product [Adineta steineri]
MASFTDVYDEKVGSLMDKIDEVRSLVSSSNNYGISFPSIIVVGDQSSGKSTLLEALSEVELPRGSGIITRCPIVLRLRKSNIRQVYHIQTGGKKVVLDTTRFKIRDYIENETQKLAGNNKQIVDKLIELQVEDPNVRDLTVVDLPGIARNPIAGQPKNIHKQTTDLIRKYIREESSVILCVFPANVDIATVESFTLAQEYDKAGTRTIGVITKSDLAPNPKDLAQQLLMTRTNVQQLKLGLIAVCNREAEKDFSLQNAREREKTFFQKHPALTSVGSNCLGIDALINRLADLYCDRVKEMFPKIRSDIQQKLKVVCEQLSKLPQDLETTSARLAKYHELTDYYIENILKSRLGDRDHGQHTSMINIIHRKFEQFEQDVHKCSEELFKKEYREKVRSAISGCLGEQLPNFLSNSVLKHLIGEKLDQLYKIVKDLIEQCFHEVSILLLNNENDTFQDDLLLMKLLPVFREAVGLHLKQQRNTVCEQVEDLIRLEKFDPYTLNSYYMDTITKFKNHSTSKKSNDSMFSFLSSDSKWTDDNDDNLLFKSVSNEDSSVQEMLFSIYSYWKVLTKRFIDYTALSVRAECVFSVCSGIRDRLRRIPVEKDYLVDLCLTTDASMRAKRDELQQTKKILETADAILGAKSSIVVNGITNINDDTGGFSLAAPYQNGRKRKRN